MSDTLPLNRFDFTACRKLDFSVDHAMFTYVAGNALHVPEVDTSPKVHRRCNVKSPPIVKAHHAIDFLLYVSEMVTAMCAASVSLEQPLIDVMHKQIMSGSRLIRGRKGKPKTNRERSIKTTRWQHYIEINTRLD